MFAAVIKVLIPLEFQIKEVKYKYHENDDLFFMFP